MRAENRRKEPETKLEINGTELIEIQVINKIVEVPEINRYKGNT